MADTPYTGEFVAGDVMPTSGVTYDLSQLNQSVQSLVEANEQRKIRAEKRAEEQKEKERKQKLEWDKLDLDAVAVWEQDQSYVDQKADAYASRLADLETKHPDLTELSPEEKKELQTLKLEVMQAKKMADDNQKQAQDWISAMKAHQQDYDVDHFNEVMGQYLDPNKTAEERYNMRINADPFSGPIVKSYNDTDVIDMAKKFVGVKTEQKGGVTKKYYDEVDMEDAILKQASEGAGAIAYKQNRLAKTDPQGNPIPDSSGNPTYETKEEYAKRLAEEAHNMLATSETQIRKASPRRQTTTKSGDKYNWSKSGETLLFSKEGGGSVPTSTVDNVVGEITRFRKSGSDIQAYINVGGVKTWRTMTGTDIDAFDQQFGVELRKKIDEPASDSFQSDKNKSK